MPGQRSGATCASPWRDLTLPSVRVPMKESCAARIWRPGPESGEHPLETTITPATHPVSVLPPVELVSVNVAEPQVIGTFRGQPVSSGIAKQPVRQEILRVDWLNLEGDRQADLRVHGGPDKAVYAYPYEHAMRWNADLQPDAPYGPGAFGENLTTRGWLEDAVHIGDIWAWVMPCSRSLSHAIPASSSGCALDAATLSSAWKPTAARAGICVCCSRAWRQWPGQSRSSRRRWMPRRCWRRLAAPGTGADALRAGRSARATIRHAGSLRSGSWLGMMRASAAFAHGERGEP